jgi:FkbM family methyltransferase
MRIMQRWARMALRRFGYEFTASRHLPGVAMAAHLRSLFDRYEIQTVLDVGANEGQYYRFLRREVGFKGQIFSFEPIPELYETLEARARADPRWRVYRLALGEWVEQREINVTRLSAFSSFLPPGGSGPALFGSEMDVSRKETVELRSLDSMIEELKGSSASAQMFLKLDTQGYDLDVIRGATRSLPLFGGLQTEISFVPIYQGMPSWEDTLRALTASGFEVSGLFPVNLDHQLRLIEADCLFVNAARPGV